MFIVLTKVFTFAVNRKYYTGNYTENLCLMKEWCYLQPPLDTKCSQINIFTVRHLSEGVEQYLSVLSCFVLYITVCLISKSSQNVTQCYFHDNSIVSFYFPSPASP